jgi:hypothetical protein
MPRSSDQSAATTWAPLRTGGPAGGLPLSADHLDSLRLAAERAAAAAFAGELAADAAPRLLTAPRIAQTPLGRYPDGAILPGHDMLASVVLPAGAAATAVVSFEPEDALELLGALGAHSESDPLARYCGAVARVGAAILAAWLPGSPEGGVDVAGGRLVEEGLVATLLATHAPPDAAVVSLELVVASEERAFGGAFTLLVDGKALAALSEAAGSVSEG